MSDLKFTAVTGGPLDENTYVLFCDEPESCILIDPGVETADVEKAVGSRKVLAVLLTHGHFDHILYASYWLQKGAKLYVHEKEVPMLTSSRLNLSGIVGQALKLPAPDVVLKDEQIFEVGGIEFKVLHTPGHTAGSVCYLCGDTLFSGDTMFFHSCGRTDLPTGNSEEMQRSLAVLLKLDPQTAVYPGHGPATKIGWEA